jgi:hypothetical protein
LRAHRLSSVVRRPTFKRSNLPTFKRSW